MRLGRGSAPHEDKYFRHPEASSNLFWECALNAAAEKAQTNISSRVVFYIASDQMWAIEAGKRVLEAKGYQVRHASLNDAGRAPDGGFGAAALDLAILEESDDLIVTRGSSYSFAAHSSSLTRPLLVMDGVQGCRRMRHSQVALQASNQFLMPDHPWHRDLFLQESCAVAPLVGEVAGAYGEDP